MLEIRNLTKIYRTKNGAAVKALDDVSISFPTTGLVFLLGKSGSGKSTLLNLAGGLDEPTGGEIVVMGKSSKDFSGSDFDSYRNTYIGFIFQEYNILNEFNVEQNVALALELQNRRKNREKIEEILREVELADMAKRKPNTLSGGQKQRIAIARALVKDPQIIMADEPTGALDSATGKQVLETLKKLSKTRLVLVVSHDREFAETYGDRIVELKDGKIISDVTKVRVEAEQVSSDVVRLGEDTLSVKRDAPITKETLALISKFISESDGDVLISKGKDDISRFKQVNRIDESGAQEKFRETTETPESYSGEKPKFIRSRLPLAKAIKMGASSLKVKPFRLVLTIFLAVVAFIMFGLFSTLLLYDGTSVLVESYKSSGRETVVLNKTHVEYGEDGWESYRSAEFTRKEIASFGEGSLGLFEKGIYPNNIGVNTSANKYYSETIYFTVALPKNHPIRIALGDSYPTKKDEIAVSAYFFETAKNSTFTHIDEENGDQKKTIGTEDDLIGEKLVSYRDTFRITGIFDSGKIPSSFDSLKNTPSSDNFDSDLYYDLALYLKSSLHQVAIVSDAYVKANISEKWNDYDDTAETEEVFEYALVSLPKGDAALREFMSRVGKVEKGTGPLYEIYSDYLYNAVESANDIVKTLSTVFLWVGVILAVFSALLLFNFISVSISSKKKEIGILRAVGARGTDVFKIFFSESSIIVGICIVLAVIGTALLAHYLNFLMMDAFGVYITIFVFGIWSLVLMLGVAVFVAVISTLLPVWLAARKKPVESIRAL